MKRRFSLLTGSPSGQTLAEFATVATVFFLVLFAIMEMGIVVYRYSGVCWAAREAARYAIVHSPPDTKNPADPSIQQFAVNQAPFLSTDDVTVSFPADPTLPAQKDAKVTITYNTQEIPFMPSLTLTLTSTSQMLVSQ